MIITIGSQWGPTLLNLIEFESIQRWWVHTWVLAFLLAFWKMINMILIFFGGRAYVTIFFWGENVLGALLFN